MGRGTGVALVVGLALVATGLAAARSGHARAAASTSYWQLETGVACGDAQQPAGNGCWDKTGDTSWSVSGNSATYTQPSFNSHFTWSVPSQIPVDGTGAVTVSTQANDTSNNSGNDSQICVSGDFSAQESDPCARASAPTPGSSGSGSKTVHLLGNSSSFGSGQVEIGFGSGYVHFFYKLVTPPPPEASPGPLPPSAREQCLGKAFRYAADLARAHPARRAHASALNELRAVKVCPDVQFHKGGTPDDAWLPVEKNTVLKQGDEITCDPDGVVVLAFADNSTVVVSNTTQLKIASFFTEGGVVRTEVLLKMGEVAAQVNKSEATKSDWVIKPPSTGGVRGADDGASASSAVAPGVYGGPGATFSVFYAPGSKTELVSASAGTVAVAPSNPSLRPVVVPPGDAVEVTPTSETPLAPIGRVGVRGGNDIVGAEERVSAVVGKARKACHDTTAHSDAFSIRPAAKGWTVAVTLGGRAHGTALFGVTGRSVKPANALARRLAAGCR